MDIPIPQALPQLSRTLRRKGVSVLRRLLVLTVASFATLPPLAFSQDAAATAPEQDKTAEQDKAAGSNESESQDTATADERIAAIGKTITDLESSNLSDEDKQTVTTLYQEAIREWESVRDATSEARRHEGQTANAAVNLEAGKQDRETETAVETRGVPKEVSLLELEQLLQERQKELDVALQEKKEHDADVENRLLRREAIPGELKQQRDRLTEITEQLKLAPPNGELPEITTARRETLESRRRRVEAGIRVLENEETLYEAERLLLPVTSDVLTTRVKRLQFEFDALQDAANNRRKNEALSRLENARYFLRTYREHPNPRVSKIAKENVELAEAGLALSRQLSEATANVQQTDVATERIRNSYSRLERRANQGSAALAILMGREKTKLPDIYRHRQQMKKRQRDAAVAQDTIYKLQERREELTGAIDRPGPPTNSQTQTDQDNQDGEANGDQSDDAVLLLTMQQRDLIDENTALADRLFETLVNASYAEQQLIDQATQVRNFIDERILWLRSDEVIGVAEMRNVGKASRWLTRIDRWKSWSGNFGVNMRLAPVTWSAVGILFIGVFAIRPRMRRRLDGLGRDASRGNCVSILPTVKATGLTVVLAGIIPAVFATLGWFCLATFGVKDSEFIRSIGAGLLTSAAVLWMLDTFRTCCRAKGLGPSHFFWASRINAIVRNTLKWYLIPAVVLSALVAIYQLQGIDAHRGSVGRLVFILLMALTFIAIRQIIHPAVGIFSEYLQRYNRGWFSQLRWLWHPLILAIPVALAGLAAIGYFYTAWQLSLRLYGTVLIVLCSQLSGSLLFRWVLVNRRRLTVAMHRERIAREKTRIDPDVAEPELDLIQINVQTQRLIRSGLLCATAILIVGVWADVLPAFRALDRVIMWHTSSSVAGELVGISVADFAIAGLVFVMMLIAAKNLPGLLEIAVLQHLPIDSAIRYAITTMGRYAIITCGVIATASLLGIAWENIQWLVAAMGVGLGFGLQEVVANFVCGVILMFERPIRVGDIITLGDVTGKISRIRIRATTLIDWDGKELIVPNKDLITGRLLNWTLTDSRNRVVIEIGIAYGSDVGQARQLMLDVAAAHREVLADPAPSVTFESFGDSALTLVLRAFLETLDNRLGTIHELNESLHNGLNEAGIEIAFPHRDLNIRSMPPLRIEST